MERQINKQSGKAASRCAKYRAGAVRLAGKGNGNGRSAPTQLAEFRAVEREGERALVSLSHQIGTTDVCGVLASSR